MVVAKNITYSLVLIITAAHFAIPSSATDPRFLHFFKQSKYVESTGEQDFFFFIDLANGISGKPKKKSLSEIFSSQFH